MLNSQSLLMDIGEGLSLMISLPTIVSWDTRGRPKKPKAGTFGFNLQTRNLEYWDGSNWMAAMMDKA